MLISKMSMLNQAAVEALCSATYLENYLDTLDTLPDDLQRIVSQMREIDFQYNELLIEINNQKDIVQAEDNPDSLQTKKASVILQRHLIRGQELGDEQLQLSSLLIEYIENRTRQLEQDLENLDPSLGREPESEPTTLSVTPSKSVKHEQDHQQPPKEKKKVHRRKTSEHSTPTNFKSKEIIDDPHPPPRKKVKSQQQQQPVITPAPPQEEKPKDVVKKKKKRKVKKENKEGDKSPLNFPIDPDEPVYCSCHQVSYGEMIGCDNDRCVIEWFHFNCVNLTNKPKGKWYCPDCRGDRPNVIRPDLK